MTLWNSQTSREYFSIFYDTTEVLICAPFGVDSIRSPYVTYTEFTQGNQAIYGWYHLSCIHESQKDLTGYFHSK